MFDLFCYLLIAFDDDLVVDRVDDLRVAAEQRAVEQSHRAFEDVGCATLNGGVLADAFERAELRAVVGVEAEDPQSARGRAGAAFADGSLGGLVQPSLDAGIGREVSLDQDLCLLDARFDAGGQALGAHPVNQAVIQPFGALALSRRDLIERDAEHLRGGHPVQVGARIESLEQRLVAREIGQDAHLYLRKIGHYKFAPGGRAEARTVLGGVRNLLQAGRRRGDAPRWRADLPEIGVNAPRRGVDVIEYAFAVRREAFAEAPVFEQFFEDWELMREFLQRPFARVFDLNADPLKRLFDLGRAVQVDPLGRPAEEAHLRRSGSELPMQFFGDPIVFDPDAADQSAPTFDVQINARQLQRRDREHTIEFEIGDQEQVHLTQFFQQLLAQRQ